MRSYFHSRLPHIIPGHRHDQTRTSLKRFFVFWIRAIVGATVLVVVLGVVFFVYRTEASSWRNRQNEAVESGAHTIDLFLRDNYETLVAIGRMDINLLTLFPQIMEENLRRSPALKEIVRLDGEGQVLTSATHDRSVLTDPYTLQQSRWFRVARDGKQYLGSVQFTADNDPYIIMAVPTTNQGVVAARLEMEVLQEVVNKIRFGSNGNTYILDGSGAIVAHPDDQVVIRHVDSSGMDIFPLMMAAPEKSWQGTFQNFLGQRVVGASLAIPNTEWVVITEISAREATSSTLRALAILGSTLLLIGAIINFATVRIMEDAIFLPIRTLSSGAERIGMGNLEERISILYNDEIGDVAKEFNLMTSRLAERESALRQARDEAVHANEFKTHLLANVGHDLRTPINMILGYTEIMDEGVYGVLNQQQQKATKRILSSARRLLNLVNSILDEAQIEAGKLSLIEQPFEPKEILQSVRNELEVPAQAKGISLETWHGDALPSQLVGDIRRIHQIVWNLAENSLKFTHQGHIAVCLDRSGPSHWRIRVTDTGIGIPPEAKDIIFDAFQQVDGSTTRENRGIGLGLSIVKQLTTLMGGSVEFQSVLGEGSTFVVTLPMIPSEPGNNVLSNLENKEISYE